MKTILLFGLFLIAATSQEVSVDSYLKPLDCDAKNKAVMGNFVKVQTVGKLGDGGKFDESTFWLELGRKGEVIEGLEIGLREICKGEKRKIVVPPEFGYGSTAKRGANNEKIPESSTLHFDVECLDVSAEKPRQLLYPDNMFIQVDTNGDNFISRDEMGSYFKINNINAPLDMAMKHDDKDGDGKISWEEFPGPKGSKDEL
jgi:hypothetical protein